MGDLRPDNGGSGPPENGGAHEAGGQGTGGSGGLPDLPPEWGTVIIPDDAAALDAEADAVRRELRRAERRSRVRRLLRLHTVSRRARQPSPAIPFVIIALALLTTMVSLFVVTWGRHPGPLPPLAPTGEASSSGAVGGSEPSATAAPAPSAAGPSAPASPR
jgi:hypothetical protein